MARGVSGRASARLRAQPSQGDHDEPPHRGLGRQAASGCEGVHTVARKLLRRHIAAYMASLCAFNHYLSKEVAEMLLGVIDVLTSMISAASSVPWRRS